jgi:hypothetical protein
MKRYPFFPILISTGAFLGLLSAAFMVELNNLTSAQYFSP